MEFIVALAIAGMMAFFVVQDAKALREEEIEVYGGSTVSPGLWGTGVFLMAIIFLPLYIWVRVSGSRELARVRQAQRQESRVPVQDLRDVQPATAPISDGTPAVEQIAKAYELFSQGAITEQEYEAIKAGVLA